MSRLVIGFNNQADNATLSGGTFAASYPRNNLKTPVLGHKARTTATSLTLTATIASLPVRVVGLFATNLTKDATYRVQAGSYDSGTVTIVTPDFYRFYPDIVHVLPADETATSVIITITDSGNSDGYLQFGRLFIGEGLELAADQDKGLQNGLDSTTQVNRAQFGERTFQNGVQLRTVQFSITTDDDEGAEAAYCLQRLVGLDSEVVYSYDALYRNASRQFLGYLEKLGGWTVHGCLHHGVGFEITEAG